VGIPAAARSRDLHQGRDGWARTDEFRCAGASGKVRAALARQAAPLIRSALNHRIAGDRNGANDDRYE
jgi:hypothetical protein